MVFRAYCAKSIVSIKFLLMPFHIFIEEKFDELPRFLFVIGQAHA